MDPPVRVTTLLFDGFELLDVFGPLEVFGGLREFSIGSWDGSTYDEIATRSPGIFDGEGRYEWYFRSQDGERYEAFAARIGEWLHELDEMCFLVVVTHGIVTRVLRGLYARLPREVALVLPVPQDKIFRLSGGSIEELAVRS